MPKLINTDNLSLVNGVESAEKNTMPLFGTCATTVGTAAKEVVCNSFAQLVEGASIRVLFDSASGADSGQVTLNVNNTGAVAIANPGLSSTPGYLWRAGDVVDFVYHASEWVIVARLMRHGRVALPAEGTSVPGATDWTAETSGFYSSTVTIANISTDDYVLVTPVLPMSQSSVAKAMQDAWNQVIYAETVTDGIKFYAEEIPQTIISLDWTVLPK
jgi:hypothetical protein